VIAIPILQLSPSTLPLLHAPNLSLPPVLNLTFRHPCPSQAGQSVVIAITVAINNCIQLCRWSEGPLHANNLFSLCLILPFLGACTPLSQTPHRATDALALASALAPPLSRTSIGVTCRRRVPKMDARRVCPSPASPRLPPARSSHLQPRITRFTTTSPSAPQPLPPFPPPAVSFALLRLLAPRQHLQSGSPPFSPFHSPTRTPTSHPFPPPAVYLALLRLNWHPASIFSPHLPFPLTSHPLPFRPCPFL
jgi:hypothetical protein